MAPMVLAIGGNGDGLHHWRRWIAISTIFVAIGANGAIGESSESFWPFYPWF